MVGNYFCISISGDDKGKIYFCNHEDPDDGDYSNLYLIAENFDKFFNSLKEEPNENDFEKYCENNDIKSIKKLLDEGLDVNTLLPKEYGYSLLNIACNFGRKEIIKLLIEKGAIIKRVFWRIFPDPEIFDILLTNGADINERNSSNETPLFLAVANRRIHVIKLLIKNGADVFATDNKGNNPLDICINDLKNSDILPENDEIFKILKEAMDNKKNKPN